MKKLTLLLAMVSGLNVTLSACCHNDNDNDNNHSEAAQPQQPETRPDSRPSELKNTLIVYYSFTNNSQTIATELQKQTEADILRVEPADPNVDYNDSIGLPMMNRIKDRPDDPASYPAVKTRADRLEEYDTILIVAPLWWNHMAAPLQTFLFQHGADMAEKNIGLIVSSGESSIEGVEADAKRLIPKGHHLSPSLWILRSHTPQCRDMIAQWLKELQ